MIPTPRPGPRFGDCPDCGRQHDGECHLAEMERDREAPMQLWSPATITYGRMEDGVVTPSLRMLDDALARAMKWRRRTIVMWKDRPLAALSDDEVEEAHKERMQARGPITDADSALTAELLLRRRSREPRESMASSYLPFRSDAEDDGC